MIIELKSVVKIFPKSQFRLDDISFNIEEGEIVGLIGSNGTGKSTILKMINGLIPYDKGNIYYQGKEVKSFSDNKLRQMRKDIAYIFQNHNLLAGESVYYHLALVYKLNHQKVNHDAINDILDFLGLMDLKQVKCHSLSGGQQQKVAIAMAVLQKPKLILCDEISSALDTNSEKEIFNLLSDLREKYGISILMIAHHLSLLKQYCDRVMILDHQTIVDTVVPVKATLNQLKSNYVDQVKEFLLHD
ncbi:ATP-binding cassette domain-containing protein [Streptococcus agalactiae]|uniref:ATP-binding cassette domain-containing protein n=1 Tax=Streptococcus agalactiae TaxID=1311 RepID=UPI002004AB87|nr:ATP-binding cassette domain-containing protein [Streptococcus agalactiae]MCC9773150.1 ATP-binding cassette domain-containing protein [Streptococcus agalactiae]MCK6260266.1 ATP-binding cassette domain-containing protein [Streptococcus agalactiae]